MVDSYLYKNSNVLINKLKIKDEEELEKREYEYYLIRSIKLDRQKIDSFGIDTLKYIHYYLFQDVYSFAGKFRTLNIEKYEKVLNGLSVNYCNYTDIEDELHRVLSLNRISKNENLDQIANKVSNLLKDIWRIHPFREGNTRVSVTFITKYLESIGIKVNKRLLKKNANYVRTALVAAAFEDNEIDVHSNLTYLYRIVHAAIRNGFKGGVKK